MALPWTDILHDPLFGISAFILVILIVAACNALFLPHLDRYPSSLKIIPDRDLPSLSVLVPARNEENNIEQCIRSLLTQTYPDYEIIVLDDDSTDRTAEILAELAVHEPRLKIIAGTELPEGWVGKNWACHQLSEAARGDLLLFVDADTVHNQGTLIQSVSALISEDAQMLTALPRQQVITWGERLIVPILYWSLFCFLPLWIAHRLRLPVFSVAIGQFMLFRRTAYDQIGGYSGVRIHGTDDLALARQIQSHQLSWRFLDGGEQVSTRMYRSFRQAYAGFSKNLFAAFDYRILPFVFAWLWIGYIFYIPLGVTLLLIIGFGVNLISAFFAVVSVLLGVILWWLVIWRLRFPRYLFLLYPAIVFLGVVIALRSVWLSLRGRSSWKGRTLDRPAIRLF